jgi:hypothetical protein
MEDACVMRFGRRTQCELNCVVKGIGRCTSWGTALRYAPPAYVPHAPWAVLDGCGGGGVTCHHWSSRCVA